jgi:NADPH:quinone reductase-like Zn-dependent oxidoreductase
MRAFEIRDYEGIDRLSLVERPEPRPGLKEVLVKVRAASLNYRDLLIIRGLYSRNLPLPLIPLSDCAGEVVATGGGVSRVKPGDRVAGIFMQAWISGGATEDKARSALGGAIDGVLAEEVVFSEEGVVPLPEHLSFEEAATLPCAGVTAWHAVIEQGVKPGQTVLVLGTGGVSLFALQFATTAGARVIVTSSSDEKLARAFAMGASEGINYRATPDWEKRVREITGGRGVDCVVEVGGSGTLARSLKAVRMGGLISLIGVLTGGAGEVNPMPAIMKAVRLQGIFVGSREMFESMNRAIEAHRFRPVVDRVFPFEEAREAYRYLESGAHFGKVVLRVS